MKTNCAETRPAGQREKSAAFERTAPPARPGVLWKAALLIVLVMVSACLLPTIGRAPPMSDLDRAYTRGAETLIARITREAGAKAVAQLTALGSRSIVTMTPTPQPQQVSAAPTLTATLPPLSPTPQPTSPTPTSPMPTTMPCDQAELIGDVTIPPGTILPTGARFKKVWRVRNTGTCTWSPDYNLVLVGGDRMGNITIFSLSRLVNPGETADLSAMLTVPSFTGVFQSSWMLRNPVGTLFGMQPDGLTPLQARVRAIQSVVWPSGTLDFAADFCAAEWRSFTTPLNCPGLGTDANGAAILLIEPALESGSGDPYGLWTLPNREAPGQITGVYPPFTVRNRDHFLARVGCLTNSPNCDVTFHLDFRTNGLSINLGNWREFYNGRMTEIDIDLSFLAGRGGNFILSVDNNGFPGTANPIWMAPRIQSLSESTSVVLSWTHEGRQEDACDELEVYLSGSNMGEARATYCADGDDYVVAGPLTEEELARLLVWRQRLAKFQAEVYQASPVRPLISWIEFNGLGSDSAREVDIQAINNYANRLFDRLVSAP
jgi:hypothetical protein